MEFNPSCLINVILALLALMLYIVGSYKFYKNSKGFVFYIGFALAIDILTATLASLRITPTVMLPGAISVPWYSLLFKVHVSLSMIGISGFFLLFIYLLSAKTSKYKHWIRKWQFKGLLPIWILGESIALCNSMLKLFRGIRLFDML